MKNFKELLVNLYWKNVFILKIVCYLISFNYVSYINRRGYIFGLKFNANAKPVCPLISD